MARREKIDMKPGRRALLWALMTAALLLARPARPAEDQDAKPEYQPTNDFYPFVRSELAEFDPQGCAMIEKFWGAEAGKKP